MEAKFPIESDFGKYFIYELYLRANNKNQETYNHLENAIQFHKCLNMNRRSLRTLNCGERQKKLDNFIEQNTENITEFKEKIPEECHGRISNYLSAKFSFENSSIDTSLYQRLNNELMLEKQLSDAMGCINGI